ncbi:Copper homeostasis protein CutC [Candidatus Ornithobacterium hominis]|uniref:copper homeostasis protein CutC n=1 Tax=Candidatus Ornithobacterium hominis TaxID=2497989 RepID=UPI000E5A3BA0|nr:copper homeostasis protein CutC [Candidatus Ornithobacterium hominis]SZD73313.1 Copper homeostasis protein CutC [Candidatus Ornithobacterium hominis]
MKHLEIACFTEIAAQIALKSEADRIEFCDDLSLGGTTPNLEIFKGLKKNASIPIFVMIRPRGGNFVYSKAEVLRMRNSIEQFRNAGADGFVFGLLDTNGHIDEENCKILLDMASNLPCSFHRAIDQTPIFFEGLEKIIELGFRTVLTSGGASAAEKGLKNIQLAQEKYGKQINIMPGGGIRSSNLAKIVSESGCNWFHSSAIVENSQISTTEISRLKKILK